MSDATDTRRVRRHGLIAVAVGLLVGALLVPAAADAQAASPSSGELLALAYLGRTAGVGASTLVASANAASAANTSAIEMRVPRPELDPKKPGPGAPGGGASLGSPNPAPNVVAGSNPGFMGFNALSHFDTRNANGGNQFSIEPPDQGLCVGHGFVVEVLNDVVGIYDTGGSLVAGPTGIAPFFGYAAEFVRPAGPFGPELTDPRCLYDTDTRRWFITALTFDTDATTGVLTGTTHVDIAVSQSDDPTGAFDVFSVNTTDDGTHGTPNHPGCPCFADEPLLGADAHGLFITSNEFTLDTFSFIAGQVYALDKWGLARATTSRVVHFQPGALADGIAYSISPATAVDTNSAANRGTEYFLSALQFGPSNYDDRIAIWAMTNTTSLASAHPAVALTHKVIESEVYGNPAPVRQKNGPTGSRPLGESLSEKLEMIDAGDDRMTQVIYQGGKLWSSLGTAIGKDGSRVGIAWFQVSPSWKNGSVGGSVARQGYVSLAKDNVLYPAIGANAAGKVVIAFSIVGRSQFPSAGYLTLVGSNAGRVHVAAAGVGPDDGFTGYPEFFGTTSGRWGDYSAATIDATGHLWVATEYIPGGPRTSLANWGTFIGRVTP
ncbi:MAG: hypothetical protein ACRDF7_04910 [Candidatus Limnocylindrales bacterium]